MGWAVGDGFEVRYGADVSGLRVGALIDLQRWGASGGRRVVVMDIAEAQSLFDGAGTLHRIGVKAAEGTDLAALAARIEGGLGGRVDAVTPSERTGQAQQLLGAFRLNLTALSLVSLLVGTFLVFSSMRACLVWQRREFGVLRSLGCTPAQVLALILGEAALLGVMGVVIGIFAGYWTAIWNLDAVSSTLTNIYMLREIESLEVSGGTLALAVFAGLGGALSGTLLPALDVWRRDTRTLLDNLPAPAAAIAGARNLFRLGLVLLAGVLAWYWLGGWRWRPAGFVLSTAMLLCLPLLAPWLVQRLTGRVRVPDFGFRYGVRSLGATLANTSFSVSSLAMGRVPAGGHHLAGGELPRDPGALGGPLVARRRLRDRHRRGEARAGRHSERAARGGTGGACRTWKASILCAACSCAWAAGAWRWWRWT